MKDDRIKYWTIESIQTLYDNAGIGWVRAWINQMFSFCKSTVEIRNENIDSEIEAKPDQGGTKFR